MYEKQRGIETGDNVYHGTEKKRGEGILASQKMPASISGDILFKNLKYGENYDAVEATIPTFELKDMGNSRVRAINEYQLCIKNDKIIKKIEDVTDTVDFSAFYPRLLDFEEFKRSQGKMRRDGSKYVNGQKGGKYGKR